jgi:hypothetical protein
LITTTTLPAITLSRLSAIARLRARRWTAWLDASVCATARQATHESAASLYARAAGYEATQPGFAADLRAAAEAMDGTAARNSR